MNQYYQMLSEEEKRELSDIINTLYTQTFLMERSYDKRSERYVLNKKYRDCERHFDFLKEYFQIANISLVENRQYGIIAIIEKNGELFENETLVSEIDYFATHKNAWSSAAGMLKITDKSLLIYNKKGAFRIYKEQVVKIRKKNYLFIVPTGIQICIHDGERKHKYNFVVLVDKRKQILDKLYQWVG